LIETSDNAKGWDVLLRIVTLGRLVPARTGPAGSTNEIGETVSGRCSTAYAITRTGARLVSAGSKVTAVETVPRPTGGTVLMLSSNSRPGFTASIVAANPGCPDCTPTIAIGSSS